MVVNHPQGVFVGVLKKVDSHSGVLGPFQGLEYDDKGEFYTIRQEEYTIPNLLSCPRRETNLKEARYYCNKENKKIGRLDKLFLEEPEYFI